MALLVRADAANRTLLALLQGHPGVVVEAGTPDGVMMAWEQAGRDRSIVAGPAEVSGLIETIDNNPLVCADSYSLPSPAETLRMVASAPLERSGLCAATAEAGGDVYMPDGEAGGGTLDYRCTIETVPHATGQDVAEAYSEAYARSLYVRLADEDPAGRPWACLTHSFRNGVVSVRVRADRDGKAGAAQAVHVFNVMAGFPESEGITDRLPR